MIARRTSCELCRLWSICRHTGKRWLCYPKCWEAEFGEGSDESEAA